MIIKCLIDFTWLLIHLMAIIIIIIVTVIIINVNIEKNSKRLKRM